MQRFSEFLCFSCLAAWPYAILAAAGLLLYAWVAYPLLLVALSTLRRRRLAPAPSHPLPAPSISIVLAAYNEAGAIAERVDNLLACQKPNQWEALIGVDGSTDATAANAQKAAQVEKRIHVFAFAERRGKVGVIKEIVHRSTSSILVFTDANTVFAPDAMIRLLRHFDDPRVGGVCGKLVLGHKAKRQEQQEKADRQAQEGGDRPFAFDFSTLNSAESGYWSWESRLKELESSLDSCLGANGAIYAIRRELFWEEIPENTIIDDFVLGMKVREQGYRMVYDPNAMAFEELPENKDEWRRRVRIGAGDFQALKLCRRCLLPRFGWFAWGFWSHKVLRWFTPLAGALVVLGSGFLVLGSGYLVSERSGDPATAGLGLPDVALAKSGSGGGLQVALWLAYAVVAGCAALALCMLAARMMKGASRLARFCRLCDHFVMMQAAIFVGFLMFCRGGLKGAWERTPREREGRGGAGE